MKDNEKPTHELDVIEGSDAAGVGLGEPPESAPSGAMVDGGETRVPGEPMGPPGQDSKPWHTTLAAKSHRAGVENEPVDDEAF